MAKGLSYGSRRLERKKVQEMIPSIFFKRSEFACKCGCGFDTVDAELLAVLDDIRIHFQFPTIVNSGCRCTKHNKKVKKIFSSLKNLLKKPKRPSQHELAKAADIWVKGIPANKVADYLEKKYPRQYGIGRYKGRTHIDVREGCARWDNR